MSTELSTPREGESLQLRIATIIQAGRNDTAYEVAGRVLDLVCAPVRVSKPATHMAIIGHPLTEYPRP